MPKLRDLRRSRDFRPKIGAASPDRDRQARRAPLGGEDAMRLTREERIAIERYLSTLGIDPGRMDGVFDEHTRAAIRTWQWMEELPPTGFLTHGQIDLMRTHALTTARNNVSAEPASYRESPAAKRRAKATWPSLEVFETSGQSGRPARRLVFSTEPVDENLLRQALREIGENIAAEASRPSNPKVAEQLRKSWPPAPDDR